MGKRPRRKSKDLPAKLLAIRQRLELSQWEMSRLLNFLITPARISECERGKREPNLLVLLAYARAGDVTVDQLIDDDQKLYS